MRRHFIIYILLAGFLVNGCYDDYELNTDMLVEGETDVFYDGVLIGRAIDESGLPMEGLDIQYSSLATTTGLKGMFQLEATRALHTGELLTLTSPTEFNYYHVTYPTLNEVHYMTVACRVQTEVHETGSSNFDVTFNDQTNLSSNDTEFLLNNLGYTGSVLIEGYHVDLSEEGQQALFPNALTSDNELIYLNKLEGLHFQWSSDDGQRLTLSENHTVQVSIPTTNNNDDVYVYQFNPQSFKWDRLEKPNLENGRYLFSISSDGYFCIASPESAIHLDGTMASNNTPIQNAHIQIRSESGELIQQVFSTASGQWHAVIPANKKHELVVKSTCTTSIFSTTIDALNTSQSDIAITANDLVTISGTSKTCNNELLPGSVIFVDDYYFIYSEDGQFNSPMPLCENSNITLSAYSILAEEESAKLNWQPLANNHIQSLFICGTPKDNYIALRADGKMRYYELSSTILDVDNRIVLSASSPSDPDFSFDIIFPLQAPGPALPEQLNIGFHDRGLGDHGYTATCLSSSSGCGFETFSINHLGEENGDWICGSFTIKPWMRTINLMPNKAYQNRIIEGEFRVKRNF